MIRKSLMRKLIRTLFCAAALAVVPAGSALAAVPQTLVQQGRLIDVDGSPTAGTVSIVFTLYDAPENGNVLWTETQTITLDDGYFSAVLGSVTAIPASAFDGTTRYLGMKIGADSEMTPRQNAAAAVEQLRGANARFVGAVLNGVAVGFTPSIVMLEIPVKVASKTRFLTR